ncbi:oxidoreductase [Phragmitibacter flavus]|uniref:Oxidoreductase n=1 Tax=Phragmitibacter flavus TaxID=2576071 RepID=A0A5R8KKI7_9BACT|nr:PDR/VanB family oxidoreductase [Phragmitibacter flavus]TLD72836.1 oxidoreductase [Phragmitibacter flavus]
MIKVILTGVTPITHRVTQFRFAAKTGELPACSPGSALRIHLPVEGGTNIITNSYSITSNPWTSSTLSYTIAVRREDPGQSRGGSIYLHEHAKPGDFFDIDPPTNRFPLVTTAPHHLLIAGGIGITPFLSYLPAIERRQQSVEVHYSFRGYEEAAFIDQLPPATTCYHNTKLSTRMNVRHILERQPPGTHVYVCGPAELINEVRHSAQSLGWPSAQIHFEHFSAGTDSRPKRPFKVHLAASDRQLTVSENETLLEVLEREGLPVSHSCRIGGCGTCELRVSGGGGIEHRDHCLTDEDRHDGSRLIACVSRAANGELVLDL